MVEASSRQLDLWLESGLRRGLDTVIVAVGTPPVSRYAGLEVGRTTESPASSRRWPRAALTAIVAIATLVWATAIGAAAATGSVDPAVWRRHVTRAVETCRTQLGGAEHGLTACVRAIATAEAGPASHRERGGRPGAAGGAPGAASPRVSGAAPDRGAPGTGTAPAFIPPGHSGAAPGQTGASPGKSGAAPGHGTTPPGRGGQHPDQSGGQKKPKN